MSIITDNYGGIGIVRIPELVEEILDTNLEKHDHTPRKFWTNRGTQRIHYWYFERESFQRNPKQCLDAMETTCKAYLNQFANEKHECILFNIGIGYKNESFTSASHTKTMFDNWTLDQFNTNYSDATNYLTSHFYHTLRIAKEPNTVKIGLFTLHCKTLSDHARKPRIYESDLNRINKEQRMKLMPPKKSRPTATRKSLRLQSRVNSKKFKNKRDNV